MSERHPSFLEICILVFIGLCLIMFLTGCVSATISRPDGTVLEYSRVGNQSIESLIVESDGSILLEKQQSKNDLLMEIMSSLIE